MSDKTHLKTEPSDTVTYRTVKFYLIVEKCCRVEKSANNNIKSSKGTGYVQLPSGFKSHRFSSSSIAAQQESNRVHVVNNGSISWIDMVKLLVYVYKHKTFIRTTKNI
jgi:hypothetical protein